MSAIKRGLRNLGRNLPRTLLVSLILGLAVALALIVFAVEEGLGKELGEIETEVGTLIEVRPVDSFGPRVEEPMDAAVLDEVRRLPGIRQITPYILTQLYLSDDALDTITAADIIGGGPGQSGQGRGARRYFAFGTGLEGFDGTTELSYGGGTAVLIEGRNLSEQDMGEKVAIVAADLAVSLNLQVGSLLPLKVPDENGDHYNTEYTGEYQPAIPAEADEAATATETLSDYGDPGSVTAIEEEPPRIEIVGIYESTSRLLARGAFMPFETVQELWGEPGELHQFNILADNIQEVDELSYRLRELLGEDVDVVAYKELATGQLDERIESMQSVLQLVLITSLVLVGVVVMATMLLIVRERSLEVGILKALGGSRRDIVTQFGAEAIFLGICGYLWGFLFYLFGGSFLTNLLVSLNAAEELSDHSGGGGMMSREGAISSSLSLGTVEASLSTETALFVLGAVVLIGLLGGILPGLYASYFKPAEVLRRG